MIELRAMRESDVEWVLALDRETEWAPHWTREIYGGYLAKEPEGSLRRFALLAELDGERAGVALGRLLLDGVENLCELEWIAVRAAARRKGVGRALMQGVEDWRREQGGLRLMLEVRAGNVTAQRLYLGQGWTEAGRRRGYYRDPVEDAVLMEGPIGPGGKLRAKNH
jgi:ribosomal-protein-alanine N-acetyltransferase